MAIGFMTGQDGKLAMEPFTGSLFKGMLAFFLLDMGLSAARNLPKLKGQTPWIYAYAVLAPLLHAGLALGLGYVVWSGGRGLGAFNGACRERLVHCRTSSVETFDA